MSKSLLRKYAFVFITMLLMIPLGVLNRGISASASQAINNSNKPKQDIQGQPPVFQDASVHDPTVVKAGNTFYVFGSHIEAAKSTDLMSWTKFTNSYTTPGNALYGDLAKNLAGSFAWAGNNDGDNLGGYAVWAPDVFWNPNYINKDGSKGAYMDYYCTSSTYKRSAIGYAVSKNIEGPYTYVDTIVYSGFTNMDNYDGKSSSGAITLNTTPTSYSKINTNYKNTNIQNLIKSGKISDANSDWFNADGSFDNITYPNALDPGLFFDKDGKLWMVYGSWSGGIYELQIDNTTGKAIYPGKDGTADGGNKVDRYFGTKLAGGYGQSGEGPYVIYNPSTGYYYLNITYGWLGADGGYNMRMFRSKSPDGPYVDAAGQNAVLPSSTSDNAQYGNKLMGNFLFQRDIGDPGTGIGVGYVSPGHNSVYLDPKTGQQFLVFHSRFPQTGEMHQIRVHQMFMNKDGWPVVAPYRYAGETLDKVNREDLIGDYKYINHGKETTATIEKSDYIHLNQDGTISGDIKGSWKKTGQNQAAITINGETYDGVFVRQWDPTSNLYVMTFTAMSNEGITIWGSKLPDKTDQQVVDDVYNDLSLGDTNNVISNLTLPTEGTRHTQISWETSDANVITKTGVITRPKAGSQSAAATLTATITKGDITKTKTFNVTVLPYNQAGLAAQYNFENNLNDSTGKFGTGSITGNRIDNTGGTISYAPGKNGQAAVFDGASGIKLPAGLISSNTYSVSLWVKPEQLTMYTTTFFGALDSNHWVSLVPNGPWAGGNTEVWSGSATWFDGYTGATIPTNVWTHLAFTVDNGTITVYVNGVQKYTGTNFPDIFTTKNASFALGVNWWDPPYKGLMDDLRVYEGALSPSQIADLANAN